MQIENIEKKFLDFEKLMDNKDYIEANKLVKLLDSLVRHLETIIDEVPGAIVMATALIPKRIEELNKDYKSMLLIGFQLDYLNIDYISYINNETPNHNIIEDSYYYKSFSNNGKEGFIEISENNSYFFIEIMYNYAIIETAVKENDINYAVINILNILNSIKYNKTVISNEVGKSTFLHKEILYEIEKPKVQTDDKNFLDFIEEYDKYVEPKNSVKDEDKITN